MNRPAEIRRPVNEARIGKQQASDFSASAPGFSGRPILARAFMLGAVATA
jgi:hypothetical protein